MRRLEALVPPPLVALIFAAVMWGVTYGSRPLEVPRGLRIALSLAVPAVALASAAAGVFTFLRAGANIDPHGIDRGQVLVTQGVYRLTRNPMYLGLGLILGAWSLYLMSPADFLMPFAFAAYITEFQILPEERAMLAIFGGDLRSLSPPRAALALTAVPSKLEIEQRLPHHGGSTSTPVQYLIADHPLVDQHPESVDDFAAARLRQAQKFGQRRVGDDVGDEQFRP